MTAANEAPNSRIPRGKKRCCVCGELCAVRKKTCSNGHPFAFHKAVRLTVRATSKVAVARTFSSGVGQPPTEETPCAGTFGGEPDNVREKQKPVVPVSVEVPRHRRARTPKAPKHACTVAHPLGGDTSHISTARRPSPDPGINTPKRHRIANVKRERRCSACSGTGHYAKTCPASTLRELSGALSASSDNSAPHEGADSLEQQVNSSEQQETKLQHQTHYFGHKESAPSGSPKSREAAATTGSGFHWRSGSIISMVSRVCSSIMGVGSVPSVTSHAGRDQQGDAALTRSSPSHSSTAPTPEASGSEIRAATATRKKQRTKLTTASNHPRDRTPRNYRRLNRHAAVAPSLSRKTSKSAPVRASKKGMDSEKPDNVSSGPPPVAISLRCSQKQSRPGSRPRSQIKDKLLRGVGCPVKGCNGQGHVRGFQSHRSKRGCPIFADEQMWKKWQKEPDPVQRKIMKSRDDDCRTGRRPLDTDHRSVPTESNTPPTNHCVGHEAAAQAEDNSVPTRRTGGPHEHSESTKALGDDGPGGYPYACSMCDEAFAEAWALVEHVAQNECIHYRRYMPLGAPIPGRCAFGRL